MNAHTPAAPGIDLLSRHVTTATVAPSPARRSPQKAAPMNQFLLPVSVRAHRACQAMTGKVRRTWDERHDERGIDEAVTRMIWLAVGIGVAVAATAFFVNVFDDAKANVPDPVAPVP